MAVHEPLELCLAIMDERAYARAKDAVDRAEKAEDVPDDAMSQLVQEIEFEIVKEQRAKRQAIG